MQKHIVVVLGMHRSGTSATTRALQVLDIDLGDYLAPAIEGMNDKGFWEDLDINQLNIEMLETLGSDWDSLIPLNSEDVSRLWESDFKLRAVEILRKKFSGTSIFGLKDPRLARVLPFWKLVFEYMELQVSYVIACRNPMSVARSLQKRDGFELEKGYYLWLEYVLKSLIYTQDETCLVVDYDNLLDNSEHQFLRLSKVLRLKFDSNSPAYIEYKERFLESSLRHTVYKYSDLLLDKSVPKDVAELYAILMKLSKDELSLNDNVVKAEITRINKQLESNMVAFNFMEKLDRERNLYQSEIKERDKYISQLSNDIAEQKNVIKQLNYAFEEQKYQLNELNQTIDESKIYKARLQQELLEKSNELDQLKQIMVERDNLLLIKSDQLFETEKQLDSIKSTGKRLLKLYRQWIKDRIARLKLLMHPRLYRTIRKIEHSDVFDNSWYLSQYPDVAALNINPIVHYCMYGASEGRKPNPLFDTEWYLGHYEDIDPTKINPLLHFITHGSKEGRKPNPLFDVKWYLGQYLDVVTSGINPLVHYLNFGWKEGRKPNPFFDSKWYLKNHPDVAQSGRNPLEHYLSRGCFEGRSTSQLFDSRWYREKYPDVTESGMEPLEHYITYGLFEGRNSNPFFEPLWYLNTKYFNSITDLAFTFQEEPLVSIIIPVYNNWEFTERCLKSLKKSSGNDIPYEVILADDCSSDRTNEEASKISGLKIIRNKKNFGFLGNCNNAAKFAKGKYIVLLNNDTEVGPAWLKNLLSVFLNFDKVGVVAGKLIYPNGQVQEAGGIMLRNGWGNPYGRFKEPLNFEFNYVKEVDCAIGACLMIDRELFENLGGFDELYKPAHYEEFDLEFSVQKARFKVMYQPDSEIVHYESVSGGSEFRDKQSLINHEKFCQKWEQELIHCADTDIEQYLARDHSKDRKTILVVEDMVPHYDKHAGAVTIKQYIKLLLDFGFKVVLLPDNLKPEQPYTKYFQQLGVEVIYGDFDFEEWFINNGSIFDYCWLCRPDIAIKYIDTIRNNSSAKILYYTHDLHFLREHRYYELDGDDAHLIESNRYKLLETEIFNLVDVVLTPSSEEENVIKELCDSANVMAIPAYFYDVFQTNYQNELLGFKDRRDILFLGGFSHVPNVDAVLWFTKEVFPLVQKRLPDVVFHIAGSNVPENIRELESASINVIGYVEDLDILFEKFRIFVAPLRFGAGVKGKIVTSLHHGIPVVTTSIGNEGLNLINGKEAMIADDPEEFASHICQLYESESLWNNLSNGSRQYISDHFSIEAARNSLLNALGITAERCHICGDSVFFIPKPETPNLREMPVCKECWTLTRMNDLAFMLVRSYGGRINDSLHTMFQIYSDLSIYEIGYVGPIHELFSLMPNFICSEYFDDLNPGEVNSDGIRCENVENLTFPDESFDLIISQDVFEHVSDPIQGFREIYRVLKDGGIHAFTIPFSNSLKKSFTRAKFDNGKISYLVEPEYHGDPLREKGALVFTDFGNDLPEILKSIGFDVKLYETNFPQFQGGRNIVFVIRKHTKNISEVN